MLKEIFEIYIESNNNKKRKEIEKIKEEIEQKRKRLLYLEEYRKRIKNNYIAMKWAMKIALIVVIVLELYLIMDKNDFILDCSLTETGIISCKSKINNIREVVISLIIPLSIAYIGYFFAERAFSGSTLQSVERELYEIYCFLEKNKVISDEESIKLSEYRTAPKKNKLISWFISLFSNR